MAAWVGVLFSLVLYWVPAGLWYRAEAVSVQAVLPHAHTDISFEEFVEWRPRKTGKCVAHPV